MKKATIILVGLIVLIYIFIFVTKKSSKPVIAERRWKVSAIDTVKYSRDMAREKATSKSYEEEIDKQIKNIASTGATHVSIGTPYDEEFIPFMSKWVATARKYGLKVWFRGNFSGWEKWFEYQRISREEHTRLTKEFISDNGSLFEDGDIFTSCPECENGGNGDPRHNSDLEGHRQFLIKEYQVSKEAFRLIGKNVTTNYFPMNGDVAKLVMDTETTRKLGGVVTVDHYVKDPEKLNNDLTVLANLSGGKIVLGEFGAPIPDIHGEMTNEEQADWIDKTLTLLQDNNNVIGINYWTNVGGSTAVWNYDGTPKKTVSILTNHFTNLLTYPQ
jgi:hypothetical protein